MEQIVIDCHMHTKLCGHAGGETTEYVENAAAKGLKLITFTCHIPMARDGFGQKGTRMKASELPAYLELVQLAADRGKELGVEVLCGIEAEIFPRDDDMAQMQEIIDRNDFDFVLGSLHHQTKAFPELMEEEGVTSDDEMIRRYYEILTDAVTTGRYDSLAHPDLIQIYGTVSPFETTEYEALIRRLLEACQAYGVCLEMNTSGWTKGRYEVHPDPVIVKWAHETGNCFTIGSDSHAPNQVGRYFDRATKLLLDSGITELTYYRKRVAHTYKIELGGMT